MYIYIVIYMYDVYNKYICKNLRFFIATTNYHDMYTKKHVCLKI